MVQKGIKPQASQAVTETEQPGSLNIRTGIFIILGIWGKTLTVIDIQRKAKSVISLFGQSILKKLLIEQLP